MAQFNTYDPRNENTLVSINGALFKRTDAKISVLDSLAQGGDGVWEGLRVYNGKIYQLTEHAQRMVNSAKALAFTSIPTVDEIKTAVFECLKANKMSDGVHIRLTLSRGLKETSGMNPHLNTFGPTLIVLPEYKGLVYGDDGISLITSSIRRNPPQCLDSKIHHNNLLNNILAKIEANASGVDDAVMLDVNGLVSETNATNIFFVKNRKVITPFATSCLPGLTRDKVMSLCKENEIECIEKDISISEMYISEECFTTGTMGALAWVRQIDGRTIGDGVIGKTTQKINDLYKISTKLEAEQIV